VTARTWPTACTAPQLLRAHARTPGLMCRTAVHADERSEGCPWEEILQTRPSASAVFLTRMCRSRSSPIRSPTLIFSHATADGERAAPGCVPLTPGHTTASQRIDCCCSASTLAPMPENRCVVTGEGCDPQHHRRCLSMAVALRCARQRSGRATADFDPSVSQRSGIYAIRRRPHARARHGVLSWHSISGVTRYSIAGVTFARGDPDSRLREHRLRPPAWSSLDNLACDLRRA